MTPNARIAHLAGPNATIQNTPPLVTSNKPRSKQGLTALTNPDGSPARFDVLRPQRLAAPVTVYVEQFRHIPSKPTRRALRSAGRLHRQRRAGAQRTAERD